MEKEEAKKKVGVAKMLSRRREKKKTPSLSYRKAKAKPSRNPDGKKMKSNKKKMLIISETAKLKHNIIGPIFTSKSNTPSPRTATLLFQQFSHPSLRHHTQHT